MKVDLLNYTQNPQQSIACAARLCYSEVGASDLINVMSTAEQLKILDIIIKNGHLSALEHASYTFAVEGVSRSLTHQLVRHRIASFNQQSQRYVKIKDSLDVVCPGTISESADCTEAFDQAMQSCFEAYQKLIDLGVPKEDARYVLPNATHTSIVITMNVRELLHFFSIRCCNRAQWEIREMATLMLALARPTAPFIFMDAGPGCVRGSCSEKTNPCKKPYKKVSRDGSELK